jgi:hypothetical protein
VRVASDTQADGVRGVCMAAWDGGTVVNDMFLFAFLTHGDIVVLFISKFYREWSTRLRMARTFWGRDGCRSVPFGNPWLSCIGVVM